jgi:hypothetical protein
MRGFPENQSLRQVAPSPVTCGDTLSPLAGRGIFHAGRTDRPDIDQLAPQSHDSSFSSYHPAGPYRSGHRITVTVHPRVLSHLE